MKQDAMSVVPIGVPTCIMVTLMREKGDTGVQTHIGMAAELLREDGFAVTVLTPFSGGGLLRIPVFGLRYLLKYIGGSLEVYWYRYGHYIYLKRALRSFLQTNKAVDVIYAHCVLSAKAALELRESSQTRVVLAVHFNGSQAFEWEQRGKIKMDGWLYRQILKLEEQVLPTLDCCIYVSDYMRRIIQERIPASRVQLHYVIPNFLRVSIATPPSEMGDLISIGTLEPRKNQQYALHVIAELKERGMQPKLTVVGDGEDRRRLVLLAETLGITNQVQFLGHRLDVAQLLAAHRLCLHAASIENCSIVLLEALRAGVPIVAARNGGTPEILQEDSNGRFWDLDNVGQGADVVEDLLRNDDVRARMSKQAMRDFEAKYAFGSAGRRLKTVLLELASLPPG